MSTQHLTERLLCKPSPSGGLRDEPSGEPSEREPLDENGEVLCGFDVREISERLFMSEANAYKRLRRARSRLREVDPRREELT